jgi:hypothetical protein
MGNEYTTLDGIASPKFKRRMMAMAENWLTDDGEQNGWLKDNGEPKFQLLPVKENFEDYVESGKINIIDWINLSGDKSYDIGKIIENIKTNIGKGIAIVVVQKSENKELGRGGDYTRDMADVYFTLDPLGKIGTRLSVGKVKAYKHSVTGRSWGFEIRDFGANLTNIRELKKCYSCHGTGSKFGKECSTCFGKGWLDDERH